ncbi:MAG: hypothetical protein IJ224_06675 [Lachnospiraceae bacterium]|nr:hypothetical protein [Lachnospiraceae bacterium]
MLNLLFGLAAANTTYHVAKDKMTKKLSAEHWNNEQLLHEDRMNPYVSGEDILRNAHKGKYYSPHVIPVNTSSNIVINENETDMLSYYSALDKHSREYANLMYKAGAFRMKDDSPE